MDQRTQERGEADNRVTELEPIDKNCRGFERGLVDRLEHSSIVSGEVSQRLKRVETRRVSKEPRSGIYFNGRYPTFLTQYSCK